jgi:cytochrome c-type biogenesis protein CcmH
MALWIAMAALGAAACLPLLLALNRPPAAPRRQDVAIYRDQLAELERDVDRGLVQAGEADAARAEIARRLIKAGAEAEAAPRGRGRMQLVARASVLAAPLLALALYLGLGSPTLPDQPLAARLSAPPEAQDLAALLAGVERHLAQNPDDGKGWEVLAPVYLRLGRSTDAAKAYGNAVRLLGSTVEREIGLGQALAAAADGRITAEARAAFERAGALAPDDPAPRFYIAVALGQEGRTTDAIAAWKALLAGAPQDATWAELGRTELARLQALAEASPDSRGPTAEDIAGAADLPADQRAAMIEGMVASLAARLESEPADAEGWSRLIRSYVVLGRADDARAALAKADAALAADAAKRGLVQQTARELGVTP